MLWGLVLSFVVVMTTINAVRGQECTLDDAQSTQGNCQPIRSCRFAINNLHADVKPKSCNKTLVCCPTQETIAEKKCQEWKSYLQIPINLDPTRLPDPYCTPLPLRWGLGIVKAGAVHFNEMSCNPGGGNAELFEFPHAVALGYGQLESELRYLCGGTLISEDSILTAGHCITTNNGHPTFALIGDITLTTVLSHFRQIVPIREIIVHPDYKRPLTYNDIAVIKLKHKLELSRYLLPACLPRAVEKQSETVEAIGWGTIGPEEQQSPNLQAVNLTLYKPIDCEPFYSDAPDKSIRFPQGLKRTQFCAGDPKSTGKDTCNGDGGGPVTQMELHKNQELRCLFQLVGVTSFGPRLCGSGTPGVYTKVLSYVPWIEKVVFGSP